MRLLVGRAFIYLVSKNLNSNTQIFNKEGELCSASTWKSFWQQLHLLLVLQVFLLNSILKNYVKLFNILI